MEQLIPKSSILLQVRGYVGAQMNMTMYEQYGLTSNKVVTQAVDKMQQLVSTCCVALHRAR
jgi:predicted esterase YcpF (UPF0227 family)